MRIELKKKPSSPTIIQGFPGFGLIGTISTEFLIEHLKAESIGEFIFDELDATAAIHKGKLVKPMEVFYDEKHNLVILHTILSAKGVEWMIAEEIVKLAHNLNAKRVISLEGVFAPEGEGVLSYGDDALSKLGAPNIQESIVMGVTASLMVRYPSAICLFAKSHSQLPDSHAAAQIIELLNKYLDLGVDSGPLLEQAKEFENKFQNIMQQANKAGKEQEKKELSYFG